MQPRTDGVHSCAPQEAWARQEALIARCPAALAAASALLMLLEVSLSPHIRNSALLILRGFRERGSRLELGERSQDVQAPREMNAAIFGFESVVTSRS